MIKEVVIQIAPRRLLEDTRSRTTFSPCWMMMTGRLRNRKGVIKRTLKAGENAEAVARKLTRDMHMRRPEDNWFNQPLHYPDVGWR